MPCGARSTRPRFSRIFRHSVAANPAHSSQAIAVDGPRLDREVDARGIDEVAALQQARRQPEQEADRLFVGAAAFEPEVVLERHAAGQEVQQRDAHAERRRGDRRDAELAAALEDRATDVDREVVEAVEIQVDAFEERVDPVSNDALGKATQTDLGVDVERHLREGVDLRSIDRPDVRAGLPVEVRERETIEVGDVEVADAEPRQRQQVATADAAEAGDRDAAAAQSLLLGLGHPSEISRERFVVSERRVLRVCHSMRPTRR